MCLKTLEIKFALPSHIKLNQAIGSIMQGVLMETMIMQHIFINKI